MQKPDTLPQRKWLALILGGLMSAIGLFSLGVAGLRTWQARASAHWPQAQATVEQSGVEAIPDSKGRTTYRTLVRYLYQVEGREIVASRVYFGDSSFLLESDARAVAMAYPVGKVVSASYDPEDVASAVLEPGQPRNLGLLFVLGGVFGVPGLIILALTPRQRT